MFFLVEMGVVVEIYLDGIFELEVEVFGFYSLIVFMLGFIMIVWEVIFSLE